MRMREQHKGPISLREMTSTQRIDACQADDPSRNGRPARRASTRRPTSFISRSEMGTFRRAGLTLLELMLAVAGTALVSAAIAAMTTAVTHGTDSRTDLRTLLVKQKTITARLTAAIRSSKKVLAASDDAIVLWLNDDNASGTPNLSEIQRIVRDAGSKEMLSFTAPDSLLPAQNTSYDLATTNFEAVTAALEDTADFPSETWATNIDVWEIDLNHADAKQASLVSNRLTLTTGSLRDITIAAAALRNR